MTMIAHEGDDEMRQPRPAPADMSAEYEVRLGRHVVLSGRARITPAGVICAGVAAAAIILAAGAVARSARQERR